MLLQIIQVLLFIFVLEFVLEVVHEAVLDSLSMVEEQESRHEAVKTKEPEQDSAVEIETVVTPSLPADAVLDVV